MKTWLKVLLVLMGLTVLLGIPATRKLLFVALPLGFGWDDFAFWVVFILTFIFLSVKGIISWPRIRRFLTHIFEE